MRISTVSRLTLLVLCALSVPPALAADDAEEGKTLLACSGRTENFSPFISVMEVMDACAKLIASGRYQGGELAALLGQRGHTYLQINESDKAIADFTAAIALKPSADRYSGRGQAYRRKHDTAHALADYTAAMALAPTDANLAYTRSLVYRFAQQYDPENKEDHTTDQERAISDLTLAIKLDPANATYKTERGSLYLTKNNPAAALADYDAALKLIPKDFLATLNSGIAYLLSGRADLALERCEAAVAISPHQPVAKTYRGIAHLKLGHLNEASADFDEALRRDKRSATALFGRGMVKLQIGDKRGGNNDIDDAKEKAPNIEAAFAKYGIAQSESE